MDLRITRTRNSIFSAFLELRSKKALERITVKELTEKAGISKQTFYLHFKDIYDLADYLENDAIEKLISDIPNPELFISNPAEATAQLCYAFINQGHMFNILFPANDKNYGLLTSKLEAKIKETIFKEHPELNDLSYNVKVTMLIQGCSNALLQYKNENPDLVIQVIADTMSSLSGK